MIRGYGLSALQQGERYVGPVVDIAAQARLLDQGRHRQGRRIAGFIAADHRQGPIEVLAGRRRVGQVGEPRNALGFGQTDQAARSLDPHCGGRPRAVRQSIEVVLRDVGDLAAQGQGIGVRLEAVHQGKQQIS